MENSSDDVEISDISLRLGYLYYRGEGCEQNKEKAEEYFNKSVDFTMKKILLFVILLEIFIIFINRT